MHIFIDESGTFTGIGAGPPRFSLIGALIVEDARLPRLTRAYRQLRQRLPQQNGEVKGRALSERHVDEVVSLLRHHGAIFEAAAIDLGVHSEAGISGNRSRYADRMTRGLTSEHSSQLRDSVWSLRRRLEGFPTQLYVQSQVTFALIRNVIQNSTIYYSQRFPRELEYFNWVVDAKGDASSPTDWEDWWRSFILPELQHQTLKEPLGQFTEGDYRYLARFRAELSPFLRQQIPDYDPNSPPALDLTKLMTERFRFSSAPEPGLEMVDVISNATRRAFMGNLREEGWWNIPTLMIGRTSDCNVTLVGLENRPPAPVPWAEVARHFSRYGRPMLKPRRRRAD